MVIVESWQTHGNARSFLLRKQSNSPCAPAAHLTADHLHHSVLANATPLDGNVLIIDLQEI